MIVIALGANLISERYGSPAATLDAALDVLAQRGLKIVRRSPWYESEPVPASSQPWFVNGVAAVQSAMAAQDVLALLHDVERDFGRVRKQRWEARVLDLDLIAIGDQVLPDPELWHAAAAGAAVDGPVLPHPRMHGRRFVLMPMADIAADWRHPILGRTVDELLAALPPASGIVRPLGPARPGGPLQGGSETV